MKENTMAQKCGSQEGRNGFWVQDGEPAPGRNIRTSSVAGAVRSELKMTEEHFPKRPIS